MSADKGDSDLDVFDELKPQVREGRSLDDKRTLLGIQAVDLPPVPGSTVAGGGRAAPPPPSRRVAVQSRGDAGPPRPETRAADAAARLAAVAPKAAPAAAPLSLDDWAARPPEGRSSSVLPPPPEPVKAPPVPAKSPAGAQASGESEGWEDDDDKTTIYDKEPQGSPQDLLRPLNSSPSASGRPPPPMSRPPGAMMPPHEPRPARPSANVDTAFVPVAAPTNGRLALALLGALVVVLVAVAAFMLFSPAKRAPLHITVTGPGSTPIAGVEVLVNGELRCTDSPCEVPDLKPDTYLVVARAPGYQSTGEIAVDVSGAQSVKNITLEQAVGTGIQVRGEGSGLMLSVDGREIGPLPQDLREMEPGDHSIRVSGGERFADHTQQVTVEPRKMTQIGPVKLRVVKGLATIIAGQNAEGADITLRVGTTKKLLPALPIKLEVDTSRSHVLIAKRRGFLTFQQPITFGDGQAERVIVVNLVEDSEAGRSASRRLPGGQAAAVSAQSESILNLNSTPPSNVVLDGKPLGSTPHVGLTVEPGKHNVLFILGLERKRKTVEVGEGAEETVSVQF